MVLVVSASKAADLGLYQSGPGVGESTRAMKAPGSHRKVTLKIDTASLSVNSYTREGGMATRPRKGDPLSARFVESVKRPAVYGDGYGGRGLSLRVKRSKYGLISKNWVQRIRIDGRSTNIGIGRLPGCELAGGPAGGREELAGG